MESNFHAALHTVPLRIDNFFFSNADIQFFPLEKGEKVNPSDFLPRNVSFASDFQFLDDSKKHFQVSVSIKSAQDEKTHTSFKVNCIGCYTWAEESVPDENTLKQIYSWSVAVQVGAIRQYIMQETARGPFSTPYCFPITLVEIKSREILPQDIKKKVKDKIKAQR